MFAKANIYQIQSFKQPRPKILDIRIINLPATQYLSEYIWQQFVRRYIFHTRSHAHCTDECGEYKYNVYTIQLRISHSHFI